MMEEDEPPMAEKAEPAIEGALASRSADVAEPEAPAGSERAEEDGGGNQDAREEWEEWMDEVDDPNFGVEPVFKSDATKLDDDAALLEHMEEEHVEPHVVEEVQVKESEPRGVEQDQALQRAFAFAERTCSDEQLVRACCVVLVLAGPGQRLTLKEIVSKVKEMDLYSFSKSCLRPHNDVNSVLSRAGAPFERVRIQGGGFCLVKGAYDEWLASGMPTSRDQPPEKKKLQIEVGVPEAAAAASEPDSDDEEPLVPAGSADEPDLQSPDGAEPQKAVVRRQRSKQRPRSSSGGSLSDPASLIARKVEIFWIDDNEWYPGTIAAYNPSTQLFTIFYEDDEVEETRIPHEHVRLMDESVSSETLVTHSWGQKWKNKHNNRQYYRCALKLTARQVTVSKLLGESKPPEVAKLVALFETPNKEMMFKGRFFCRKPELDRLGIDVPTENKGGAEELFLSDRVEERPLDAVLKRCTVNCTWEDSRNPRLEEEDQDPELFYSRAVLLETKEICSLEQLPGVEVANVVNHVPAEAATADAVVAAEGAAAAARRRFSVVLQSVWDSFDEPPKPVHRGEKSKESDKGWRGVGQRGQGKFRAQASTLLISIRNPVSTNQIYLGSYVRPEVAARAFDTAMLALHGKEKADRLNFDLASYSEAEIHGARTYIETIAPLALKSSKVKPSPKDASANKHATEHKKAAAKGPEHVEKSSPKSVPGSIKRRLDDLPSQEERQQAKKAKIARSAAPGDISADVSQPRAADQIQYPRFKRKEPHLELSPAEPSTTTGPKNLTPQPPSQPDAPEPDSRAQADGRTVQSTVNNDRPQSFRIPRRSALSAAPGAPAMTVRSMSNGSLDALANSAVELADRSAAPPSTAARLHHSTPASSPRQPRERYPSHRERERLPASPIKLSGQAPVANGSAGREPTAMSQKTHYTYEDFKMKYRGRQPHSKPVTPMLPQAATGLHLPVPLWVQYREGFVFRCEGDTMDACFKHMLFGEKEALMPIIDEIDRATALFLYNTQSRYLYGVYECTARGGMNLQPNALVSRGPDGALTAYPAQVRVKQVQHFEPIRLSEFRRVVTYKPDASVGEELFDQKLSAEQVTKLMQLMHEKAAVLEDAGSPSATPAVALAVASPHARASAEPSTRPHVDNDVPPPPLTPLPTVPSAPEQPPLPSVPPPPPPASQSQPLSEPTSFVREPSHSGATPAAVAANAEGAVDDGTASGRPSIPDLNLEPPEVAPVAAVAAADVDEELVRDAPPNEAQVDTGVRFSTGVEDRSRERQHDAAMSRSHSNVSGALSNREERSSAPVREDSQHLQEVRSDDQAPSRASHPQHNNSDQPWSREHSESRRNDSWRGDARKGADDRYYSTPRKQQWQASGSHRGYGNERDARKYSSSDRQGDRHYYDHRHNSDRVRKREGYHHSPHQDKRGGYKDYDRRPGPPSGRDRDGHERDRLRSTGDRDRDRERERDWDREQDRYYRDRQYDRQRERDRHYHQGSDHRWNERDHSPSRNRPGENARHGSDHDGSLRGSGIRNETGTSSAPAHIPDLNQNPSPQETMAAVHTSGGAVAGFQAQCGSSSSDTSDTSTPSSSSASDKEASLFAGVTQTR
eukprot:jgi/Chlat1/3840/Chrsp26S08841